jgi:hypothetical protein
MARLMAFLLVWLSSSGWAQAPAIVDTGAECKALGGAWVQRSGWYHACQTPWGREECLRLGGGWTPMVGAPANGVCVAALSDRATARQCTEAGGTWGPPGSAMPFCQPGTATAQAAPTRKAPDAGKACDSQRDCTYGCVYTGAPVAAGADVMGHCRADNKRSGCHEMVEKGRLAGRICLD